MQPLADLVAEAREVLRQHFGIDDLSIIERAHLRLCAESATRDWEKMEKLPGGAHRYSGFPLHWEVPYRWLWKCYGIGPRDVWAVMEVTGETTGEHWRLPWMNLPAGRRPEYYDQYFEALLARIKTKGHQASWDDHVVDPAFQEYIRRLRKRSHIP